MKKLTIVFRKSPLGTTSGREGLDFAMLSASFEQEVSLVFINDAVLHLLPSQAPELTGSKDYIAALQLRNFLLPPNLQVLMILRRCSPIAMRSWSTDDITFNSNFSRRR
jgi:sulfur relay (sulfurtransferase) complex TusBCD TusD component (DsrE family)